MSTGRGWRVNWRSKGRRKWHHVSPLKDRPSSLKSVIRFEFSLKLPSELIIQDLASKESTVRVPTLLEDDPFVALHDHLKLFSSRETDLALVIPHLMHLNSKLLRSSAFPPTVFSAIPIWTTLEGTSLLLIEMAAPPRIMMKIVVVGDHHIGKTALLSTIQDGAFPDTVIDNYDNFTFDTQYQQSDYSIAYWDSSNRSEHWERMRALWYPQSDAFLLCYSAGSPNSFENIIQKWVPELNHHSPKTPIILMCLKTDLRKDAATIEVLAAQFDRKPIEYDEGVELAKHIRATLYLESSAKQAVGISSLHIDMIRATIMGLPASTAPKKPMRRKGECTLL